MSIGSVLNQSADLTQYPTIEQVQGMLASYGNAKIETGSYVGTGDDGPTAPNILTFNLYPIVVFITEEENYASGIFGLPWIRNVTECSGILDLLSPRGSSFCTVTWQDNAISWYASNGTSQLNHLNRTYYYVALGT